LVLTGLVVAGCSGSTTTGVQPSDDGPARIQLVQEPPDEVEPGDEVEPAPEEAAEPVAQEPVAEVGEAVASGGRCRGLWYGIGDSPTDEELQTAVGRYGVVVLNAWEVEAMQRLKELDPTITVLVYKDFSSTRNYEGALDPDGSDAELLPTGLGFAQTQAEHPDWFATDTEGNLIEWNGYPGHWQMAVWDPAYQQAWATAVTAEVTEAGWDGVFADNDFASLDFYSDAVLAGTADQDATDQQIRDGLDQLVTTAGEMLAAQDKILVPNVSEHRLHPGRWTEHSRFGGAMDENFAMNIDDSLLTWQEAGWPELVESAADPDRLTLLVTAGDDEAATTGAAGAALLAGPGSCWQASHVVGYADPEWTDVQAADLGEPTGEAVTIGEDVWARGFDRGWAIVNPTSADVIIQLPDGLTTLDGADAGAEIPLSAATGIVLLKGTAAVGTGEGEGAGTGEGDGEGDSAGTGETEGGTVDEGQDAADGQDQGGAADGEGQVDGESDAEGQGAVEDQGQDMGQGEGEDPDQGASESP
jgi:hypothetical protein